MLHLDIGKYAEWEWRMRTALPELDLIGTISTSSPDGTLPAEVAEIAA